ncbi:acylneuraminate cytidylyltransferase family protein [Pseudodesulfovibrio piezophilus]|uniref:Acylneuraminate cytidylyltransferase (Modular protein) n=1 Tax=Pseudodesulfovibrio piezophilus (strain DSM 21447 / JCM 15486 / C1TLV30) TaxID=1322246 RepID=M1WMB6_PSEP2|nr:Acylneuraminate cytidylyltransferase (modular protein) [Pseudodesulfovibrio piezophilus]CCH49320.1 Acylneuraminate cytidylyltransferase (modular protein) [Pseudodesulfovibrio piezophilus C1TLV30]
MKIGALIPARNGSKRIKKKNIKMLGDRPLICWTIDTLLQSAVFDTITVSTESGEVARVVNEYYPGDTVRVLDRPDSLAHDDAPLSGVIEHYLSGNDYEYFGLFMPTYPFRKVEQLREAAYAIQTRYPWRVLSKSSRQYASMDYYYPHEAGVKRVFRLHPMFCPSSNSTYVFSHRNCYDNRWMQYGISAAERLYTMQVDHIESVDIDTPEDFAKAQMIAEGRPPVVRAPVSTRFGDWVTVTPKGVDAEKFMHFVGQERLADTKKPLLILGTATPPLNFYTIMNNAVRMYYMDREAATCFQSDKVNLTGNSAYIPKHFLHDQHYRIMRVPELGKDADHKVWSHAEQREMGWPHGGFHNDSQGLYFGSEYGDDVLPNDRVIWQEELAKQDFYLDPIEYL